MSKSKVPKKRASAAQLLNRPVLVVCTSQIIQNRVILQKLSSPVLGRYDVNCQYSAVPSVWPYC